jgi:ribosomal protein S18 acetylase RimI-like enzyme
LFVRFRSIPLGGKAAAVLHYRTFRNTDPPGLVEVWNAALTGRSAVRLRHSLPLEQLVFSKPYFDAAGLIVAADEAGIAGFAHAGFGANAGGSALATADGVTCLVAVHPRHQRRGVGSDLLRRCEAYLLDRGARSLHAGPLPPLNPFYFGLYGGSSTPGFLLGDKAAGPFLARHGYQVDRSCQVLQRRLDASVTVADGRFAGLRRRFDFKGGPRRGVVSWWGEAVLGPIELFEVVLEEKATGHVAASAAYWEMDDFGRSWNENPVGLVELEVRQDLRRQGLARFLLSQTLRYLQDQFYSLIEVQVPAENAAAQVLFRGLGFAVIDTGHGYRKS